MVKSLHAHIKEFATAIAAEALNVHAIKISFEAPPKSASETLTINKKKQFEANFQWRRFSLHLANSDKSKWYTYIMQLEPWGTKIDGTQEVIASDAEGRLHKEEPIEVTPKEIEKMFPSLLKGPDLDPNFPEGMIDYINGHEKDKGKKYPPGEFRRIFEGSKTEEGTNFYILLTKSQELKTPFGKTEGKVPTPVKGKSYGH